VVMACAMRLKINATVPPIVNIREGQAFTIEVWRMEGGEAAFHTPVLICL
jgi:hypothetical protein